MFARSVNIRNVKGRIKYCRDKEKREEVVGFYNTTSDQFWALLAKENQLRFQESTNVHRRGAKASEAREFIVGLPPYAADQMSAAMLAHQAKALLGVECVVAIHKKYSKKNGERKLNVHAHIIVAERTLLPEPVVIEEKRAERTYYYNAKGKKCKKADAVKVTHKGDIIQKGAVHYFSNKEDFYSVHKEEPLEKIKPFINTLAASFKWEKFDGKRHFAYRHVGNNNPKAAHIEAYNRLVGDMNAFFDRFDVEGYEPMKKQFCRATGVSERFGVNRVEEVQAAFEQFKATLEQSWRQELAALMRQRDAWAKDLELTESALDPAAELDFVKGLVAKANKNAIEEKYGVKVDASFFGRLKAQFQRILEAIDVLKEKLRKLRADDKVSSLHERQRKNVPVRDDQDERGLG